MNNFVSSVHSDLNILIAGESLVQMRTMRALCQSLGYTRIRTVCDGREGIDLLTQHSADVVFTDWTLPGMSGREFISWIRKSPSSPDHFIPIVLLTGTHQRDALRQARTLGADLTITKPIRPAKVSAFLAKLSPRPAMPGHAMANLG